jgi:predicted DCC family thiol-disulfide oxidoreductase YuxK
MIPESMPNGRILIIYDGNCGFCNYSVRWLVRHDKKDALRFAPAGHSACKSILYSHNLFIEATKTIICVMWHEKDKEIIYLRSDAVLKSISCLPAPWPFIANILYIIPHMIRDNIYQLLARHRYLIWKRQDICTLPTPEERSHFL